ncbi:MAG TPA: alpha/beta fold hydrolase, partial [Acidobacteriaceae bacterium]|nr:alpha/beta fold hydrolase [Acidobacteriaceae bacterium]
RFADELPPLAGVVHSAGVLDDGILAQLDWTRFVRLFEAKVYGSWLLHQHTKSLNLDFFILQSSLLSLLGSAGQANYSAANAFLDALASHRRAAGLPATVINWCAWSGGGLATLSGARGEAMWSSLVMQFISPELGIGLFDDLMQREFDQVAVASADWETYARKSGRSLFLEELLNHPKPDKLRDFANGKVPSKTVANTDIHVPPWVQSEDQLTILAGQRRFESAEISCCSPPADQLNASASAIQNGNGPVAASTLTETGREAILDVLQRNLMAELGFSEPLDPHLPLNEVGLDSLRSVSLANRLEDEFGVPISISELISGPTVTQVVDHLLRSAPRLPASSQENLTHTAAGFRISNVDRSAERRASPIASAAATPKLNGYSTGELRSADESLGIHAEAQDWPAERNGAVVAPGETRGELRTVSTGSATEGKWLVSPRPTPNARARLFCFPYAGGGLVSFRAWPQLLGDAVEVVAVEPPGRGTRIGEAPIDKLEVFVARLLPEILQWLDRPSAFFGHCLGGLTMFATLCSLPEDHARFIKHLFTCGVRPPHLLKRRRAFEDDVAYNMMLHQNFDPRQPPYAQADEIFEDIIRQFDTPAADRMLQIERLKRILLPTIRAEFAMAYNYQHRPIKPFSLPITSFVGDADPWVSEQDSAAWRELTQGPFTNHMRKGSHFLMADDSEYILNVIAGHFVSTAADVSPTGEGRPDDSHLQ